MREVCKKQLPTSNAKKTISVRCAKSNFQPQTQKSQSPVRNGMNKGIFIPFPPADHEKVWAGAS